VYAYAICQTTHFVPGTEAKEEGRGAEQRTKSHAGVHVFYFYLLPKNKEEEEGRGRANEEAASSQQPEGGWHLSLSQRSAVN
jgi:hypothetical protein